MALAQVSESEEEEYHSLSGHEPEDGEDEEVEPPIEPPMHPVPSMQGAFEESIRESTEDDDTIRLPTNPDAESRRQDLLEARQYDDSWMTRWKQKPGAQHHPLVKLIAQIVFGMHLLQQGQAKSNEEVVKILQTHVNEVDTFLERTSEDFDLAIADIEERIRHLKLPMEHLEIFNAMLDDKKFRTQLLDGNDKIEKIIDRTAKAMNAALMDVRKGLHAAHELGKYLDSIKEQWPKQNNGIADVFGAMRGNEQGWMKYLKELQVKGNNLGKKLIQLGTVIGEMSKLAAAASRRNRPTSQAISPSRSARSAPNSPGLRSKFSRDSTPPMPVQMMSLNKPLPREPDTAGGAAKIAVPKQHPVPFAQRYEQPRQSPQSPPPNTRRTSIMRGNSPERPRTAGAPRDPRLSRNATSDMADFLKHSNPLRSNPPDHAVTGSRRERSSERRLGRSQSQGANDVLNVTTPAEPPVSRSKSQGAAMIITGSSTRDTKSRPSSRGADTKSRPGSRGVDTTLSTVPESEMRKDSVASMGFARRISKRMKHIPPPPEELFAVNSPTAQTPARRSETAAPTDSAYSSGTDKKQSVTRPQSSRTENARPPSRLGLFPRATEPLTPSAASMQTTDGGSKTANGRLMPNVSSATSPGSIKSSTKSMTSSFRSIFHRRQKSRNLLA